jgi:glycerol-3-phosphate O-acyltransferase
MEKASLLYRYIAFINAPMSETLQRKANLENIIETALQAFLNDHIIDKLKEEKAEAASDFYVINEDQRPRIVFYKNSIIHYLIPIAFYSLAIVHLQRNNALTSSSLREEYDRIKKIFSAEFIYSSYKEGEGVDAEDAMLDYFETEGLITNENGEVRPGSDSENRLRIFATIIRDFLESYFIVLHTITSTGKRPALKRDIVQNIRKNGIRLFHTGDVRLMEALSLPNYNTALTMLVQLGIAKETYLGRKGSEFEIVDRTGLKELFDTVNAYLVSLG